MWSFLEEVPEILISPLIQQAVLRAIEINADVIIKGTRVDGIYTSDPEKDPSAIKFENITFKDVMSKDLKVMDMTAFTLSEENDLPIIVFDMNKKGRFNESYFR